MRKPLLYVSGTLPSRSETFVYREVFALRERGVEVRTLSVHAPESGLGDAELDLLSRDTLTVYGNGAARMLCRAIREFVAHPIRSCATISLAVRCATSSEVRGRRRIKVMWQALAALSTARRIRSLQVSHIHAHMAHVPTTIAMFLSSHLGIPFSFTGHAVDLFREGTLVRTKLHRCVFAACISEWHRDYFRTLAPNISEDRLPIVRCGVDEAAFDCVDRPEKSPSTNVLGVGRLVRKKGFDLLLQAIRFAELDELPVRFVIVGDGPEREALEAIRSSLKLNEIVTFVGAKNHNEVRSLVRGADIFVLPCRIDESGDRDGIPVALMEAMSCRIPVISGDLPAIRELIRHGESGLLVNSNDAAELGAALRQLITDRALRRSIGAVARKRVVEEFSTRINVRRLLVAFGIQASSMPVRDAHVEREAA